MFGEHRHRVKKSISASLNGRWMCSSKRCRLLCFFFTQCLDRFHLLTSLNTYSLHKTHFDRIIHICLSNKYANASPSNLSPVSPPPSLVCRIDIFAKKSTWKTFKSSKHPISKCYCGISLWEFFSVSYGAAFSLLFFQFFPADCNGLCISICVRLLLRARPLVVCPTFGAILLACMLPAQEFQLDGTMFILFSHQQFSETGTYTPTQ